VISTPDGRPLPTDGQVGEVVVLARSMDRFFNLGQPEAARIDPSAPGVRILEKLDGTLVVLYHDPHAGEWCAATRSVPDADLPVDGFGDHTFRTLFEVALYEHLGLSWEYATRDLVPGWTLSLELTGPRNRIVVDESAPRVHLLAARSPSGVEHCPRDLPRVPFPPAPSHDAADLDALLRLVNSRGPTEAEGVVLVGPDFARVKVKSEAYRLAHAARDAACASPRALLQLVLAGQDDDVFPLLPEHHRTIGERYKVDLARWLQMMDAAFLRLRSETGTDRKAMALATQRDGIWISPMMSMWQGQANDIRSWVDRARDKSGNWSASFLDNLGEQIAK
jgi:hypothetical protein